MVCNIYGSEQKRLTFHNRNYGEIIMGPCNKHVITNCNKHIIPYVNVKHLHCLIMYVRAVLLSYKVKLTHPVHVCCSRVSASYLWMLWLLASIIVKYMEFISRVLTRHTTGDLIIWLDGPCLLGHWGKKGEDSMYMQIASYYVFSYIHGYIAS